MNVNFERLAPMNKHAIRQMITNAMHNYICYKLCIL